MKSIRGTRELYKPPIWHKLTSSQRAKYINGCGGVNAWYNIFIPNHIGPIDIYPACAIHDVCYGTGYPKIRSDGMLFINMVLLACVGSKWTWGLRCFMAFIYFLAVMIFGDKFYYQKTGKKRVKPKEVRK